MPFAYISCWPFWAKGIPATGVGERTLGGAPLIGVVAVPKNRKQYVYFQLAWGVTTASCDHDKLDLYRTEVQTADIEIKVLSIGFTIF